MKGVLSKQVRARYVTVFAAFLAFMGIGVVDPLLPIIAKSIGASSWQVEMLFTAYILTMAFMMLPSGIISNKLGNKKVIIIGLGLVAAFSFLCGSSGSISQLSIFRAGWGLGNSLFFATGMILLIAFTPDSNLAIGMYEGSMGLGMAVGPLVGGFLGGRSWRYPFFATSLLILIAFILVLLFVYEPQIKTKRKIAGGKELLKLIKFPPFLSVAMSSMCYFYSFFVILAYGPLVIKLSSIQLGFVYFGWGLMLALGSAVLSHIFEDKFSPKSILPFTLLIFVIILLGLFFINSVTVKVMLIVISGLISGLNNALFTSYAMETSPYERGITSGAYNFVRWLGAAIAPVLSGMLGNIFSAVIPFAVAGVITFIGIVLLLTKSEEEIDVEIEEIV
ncbi:MAG: MFS transporter [Clostridium sp.]|uniref:MFS transporter n=1 Tax=Clostridium sp. TaxID=1506 RepID=UPI0039ECB17A